MSTLNNGNGNGNDDAMTQTSWMWTTRPFAVLDVALGDVDGGARDVFDVDDVAQVIFKQLPNDLRLMCGGVCRQWRRSLAADVAFVRQQNDLVWRRWEHRGVRVHLGHACHATLPIMRDIVALVAVIGPPSSGKSSLCYTMGFGAFPSSSIMFPGGRMGDFIQRVTDRPFLGPNNFIEMTILDTHGPLTRQLKGFTRHGDKYLRWADLALVTLDLSLGDPALSNTAITWVSLAKSTCPDAAIIVVGLKSDALRERAYALCRGSCDVCGHCCVKVVAKGDVMQRLSRIGVHGYVEMSAVQSDAACVKQLVDLLAMVLNR